MLPDHDVLQLDVAVRHAQPVHVPQTREDLSKVGARRRLRKVRKPARMDDGELVDQIDLVEEITLRGDGVAKLGAVVPSQHRDDVRMRRLRGEPVQEGKPR